MVSSTLEPFANEMTFVAPEFSPTVRVKASVFVSSDALAGIVVGVDVVSVVDVPLHSDGCQCELLHLFSLSESVEFSGAITA